MFDFFVQNSFGCEKIIIEGKEAQVVKGLEDPQGKTLLVEFEFNMVPQVQVKKEEDEMDAEEESNDVGSQYHTHSKGKRCIIERGLKRAASMEKRDASPKKGNVGAGENDARAKKRDVSEEENDARAKKRDVSEEENDASAEKVDVSEEKNDASVRKKKDVPDHFGVELFSSGHFTQPKNPYFVTKIRPKRRDDLPKISNYTPCSQLLLSFAIVVIGPDLHCRRRSSSYPASIVSIAARSPQVSKVAGCEGRVSSFSKGEKYGLSSVRTAAAQGHRRHSLVLHCRCSLLRTTRGQKSGKQNLDGNVMSEQESGKGRLIVGSLGCVFVLIVET
nr:B3 domain-containing protein At5g60140-like [Ipomoea batatas]